MKIRSLGVRVAQSKSCPEPEVGRLGLKVVAVVLESRQVSVSVSFEGLNPTARRRSLVLRSLAQ